MCHLLFPYLTPPLAQIGWEPPVFHNMHPYVFYNQTLKSPPPVFDMHPSTIKRESRLVSLCLSSVFFVYSYVRDRDP